MARTSTIHSGQTSRRSGTSTLRKVTVVAGIATPLVLAGTGAWAGPAPVGQAATAAPAFTAAASYDSTVMADSPQYYFPLNETTGVVRDATGSAAPSTVTTAQLGAAGVQGTAVSLDGVSQRVQVPYNANMKLTGSFSVELWAKLPAAPQTTGYPSVFSRGSGGPGRYGAAMWVGSDAAHLVNFKRNGKNVPSARGLSTTAYRHLVFTWNATDQRYTWYVDGTTDISAVLPVLAGVDTETAPLSIGALIDSATASPYSFGKLSIDGLAVYKSVLSGARVSAHYSAANVRPPATAPVTRRIGGVAVGDLQPWNTNRAADFAAIGAANATYIRTDIGWKYLQPNSTTWRWSLFDDVLTAAQANNLKYLAILHTVPAWANGNTGDYGKPTNMALLTDYCYQTVKRYLPRGVNVYEIGNEVNYAHHGWNATGANYARNFLIPCVSGARRAATEVGLPVNLMFGSMAPGTGPGANGQEPVAFLTEAYANGARGLTTSLAYHPYGGLNPATEPNMTTLPNRLRSVMQANGDGTDKMWATEYGLPTGGTQSWSESAQAEWVGSAYDAWAVHPYAGPLIWYSLRDTGTSATDREQHFGVLRVDGTAEARLCGTEGPPDPLTARTTHHLSPRGRPRERLAPKVLPAVGRECPTDQLLSVACRHDPLAGGQR